MNLKIFTNHDTLGGHSENGITIDVINECYFWMNSQKLFNTLVQSIWCYRLTHVAIMMH